MNDPQKKEKLEGMNLRKRSFEKNDPKKRSGKNRTKPKSKLDGMTEKSKEVLE